MDIMEIVLLTAGGIVFVLSFLIPMKSDESSGEVRGLAKEEIKTLVSEELEAVRGHVDDVVEEAVSYSIEKTERSLERLSNEKIMAVNEYSDTVLAEIHKNHEEVMFLYDMLNDKHINLKNTVAEINQTVKEAKEAMNNFRQLAPEEVIPLQPGSMDMPQESAITRESMAAMSSATAQEFTMLQETMGISSSAVPQEPSIVQESMTVLASDLQETDDQGRNYNDQIMEMYQNGKSPVMIARELDLGVGEVKLVIDLYKNRSEK